MFPESTREQYPVIRVFLCLAHRLTQGHFEQMRDMCLRPVIGSKNFWVLLLAVTYSE